MVWSIYILHKDISLILIINKYNEKHLMHLKIIIQKYLQIYIFLNNVQKLPKLEIFLLSQHLSISLLSRLYFPNRTLHLTIFSPWNHFSHFSPIHKNTISAKNRKPKFPVSENHFSIKNRILRSTRENGPSAQFKAIWVKIVTEHIYSF